MNVVNLATELKYTKYNSNHIFLLVMSECEQHVYIN